MTCNSPALENHEHIEKGVTLFPLQMRLLNVGNLLAWSVRYVRPPQGSRQVIHIEHGCSVEFQTSDTRVSCQDGDAPHIRSLLALAGA